MPVFKNDKLAYKIGGFTDYNSGYLGYGRKDSCLRVREYVSQNLMSLANNCLPLGF